MSCRKYSGNHSPYSGDGLRESALLQLGSYVGEVSTDVPSDSPPAICSHQLNVAPEARRRGGEGDGGIRLTQAKVSASGSLVAKPGALPKPAPAMLHVRLRLAPGDRFTPLRLCSIMKRGPGYSQPMLVSNRARALMYRFSSQFPFVLPSQSGSDHRLSFPTLTEN